MHSSKLGKFAVAAVLSVVTWFGLPQASWSKSSQAIQGVDNFGQVTNMLYRGAQPSAAGLAQLQRMGVTMIVNFRDERDKQAEEKRQVESLGIKYVAIPWSGSDDPSSAQVAQFLNLVRDNPQAKIFVHCKRGADRTGTMIAAYRIAVEHKAVKDAVAEMNQYHYASFWLPQLQRYVTSLPQLLQANSVFSAYAPKAPNSLSVTSSGAVAALVPVTP